MKVAATILALAGSAAAFAPAANTKVRFQTLSVDLFFLGGLLCRLGMG
jgi:hypothetical protein